MTMAMQRISTRTIQTGRAQFSNHFEPHHPFKRTTGLFFGTLKWSRDHEMLSWVSISQSRDPRKDTRDFLNPFGIDDSRPFVNNLAPQEASFSRAKKGCFNIPSGASLPTTAHMQRQFDPSVNFGSRNTCVQEAPAAPEREGAQNIAFAA